MSLTVSSQGLALIMEHEGFLAEPRRLPDGAWVVGYGHVRSDAQGEPMTEADARAALVGDLEPVADLVNAKVVVALTQAQFDALVSFAFSIGAAAFESSAVLRRVNAGDFMAAACLLDAWRKSDVGGKAETFAALVRRRAAEKAMLLADVAVGPAPSAFLRPRLDHAAAVLGAPLQFASGPEVGSIPVRAAKAPAARTLSTILAAEPATEALLLTQVVPADACDDVDAEGEIVTAHAKPVARPVEFARAALRRAYAEERRASGVDLGELAAVAQKRAEAAYAAAVSWIASLRLPRKA